jgi:hypothetical protein
MHEDDGTLSLPNCEVAGTNTPYIDPGFLHEYSLDSTCVAGFPQVIAREVE